MNQQCGTCYFFGVHTKHRHAGTRGECRRYPPVLRIVKDRGMEIDDTVYPPRLQVDDSCGEYQVAEQQTDNRDNIIKGEPDTCLSDYTERKKKAKKTT